jgi:hypothetical protein
MGLSLIHVLPLNAEPKFFSAVINQAEFGRVPFEFAYTVIVERSQNVDVKGRAIFGRSAIKILPPEIIGVLGTRSQNVIVNDFSSLWSLISGCFIALL